MIWRRRDWGERDMGDVSKFVSGETETAVNHWWPSVTTKWQGTKSDISRMEGKKSSVFSWAARSNFAECLARGQWDGWYSKRLQETQATSMPEGWRRRTWLSMLHIHLRKPLKRWLLRPNKEMNNVTQPQLLYIFSGKHLLLQTEDVLGGHLIFCAALCLLLSFFCHPPSLKGSSLKLEKVLWCIFVFLKETLRLYWSG